MFEELATSESWGPVVDAIGFALPVDYMQFIETYGSGSINDFIWVFNPFAETRTVNFLAQFPRVLGALRTMKEESPDKLPFPLMYELGGLLPWGMTTPGDILCWRTAGATGEWTTVAYARNVGCTEFKMPMSRYLHDMLRGSFGAPVISRDFAAQAPNFTPLVVDDSELEFDRYD
jgi:hypothetical protein